MCLKPKCWFEFWLVCFCETSHEDTERLIEKVQLKGESDYVRRRENLASREEGSRVKPNFREGRAAPAAGGEDRRLVR